VLGRLLAPEDVGLLAVGMLVCDAAVILRDFGLSTSIIQRESLTNEQLDRLFVWSLLLSLLTGGAIALTGEPLAQFFGEPRLTILTPWLGLTMFIAGLGIVPLNLLKRQLKLDVVGANTVISATIGAVVAILLAYAGWGVKALIAQALVGTTVSTLIAWWNAGWHPTGLGRKASMESIFTQSAGAGGAHLLNYAARNLDNVIVGRLVGMGPLGHYTRAYQFTLVPPQLIQAISAVAVPALSRLQAEPAPAARRHGRTRARNHAHLARPQLGRGRRAPAGARARRAGTQHWNRSWLDSLSTRADWQTICLESGFDGSDVIELSHRKSLGCDGGCLGRPRWRGRCALLRHALRVGEESHPTGRHFGDDGTKSDGFSGRWRRGVCRRDARERARAPPSTDRWLSRVRSGMGRGLARLAGRTGRGARHGRAAQAGSNRQGGGLSRMRPPLAPAQRRGSCDDGKKTGEAARQSGAHGLAKRDTDEPFGTGQACLPRSAEVRHCVG
jgi:hypothetical protein